MSKEIKFDKLSRFQLDPQNPRLGRENRKNNLNQEEILEIMQDWSLEELATSFLESGFWLHEAILCIEEDEHLTVIEGNRRLAALIYLQRATKGTPLSKKWERLIENIVIPPNLFEQIPYIKMESREEVDAFLGFRHVTGIKEWEPAEKAEYISYLINKRGMTYVDVMRNIGSKTETVRRNYIAFSLLLQMEQIEEIYLEGVEERFSVLFLSLRTPGVQEFLNIDIKAEPENAKVPVDDDHIENLKDYAYWLFGNEENNPIIRDSRQIDEFAKVLSSTDALSYVRKAAKPSLRKAYIIAGGELSELIELLESASYDISDTLSYVHRYKEDKDLQKVIKRLLEDTKQLEKSFYGTE